MIASNVAHVCAQIEDVCRKAGRNPQEVTLVAVTKTVSLLDIQEAVEAGIEQLAENRVQEAQSKFPELLSRYPSIKTHLIGHLQTNKAKDVLDVCGLIQSVDSLKLAEEIQKQAMKHDKIVEILLQVNTAREEQKFGADPKDVDALIEAVAQLSCVRVKGLMGMAPFTEDQGVIRKTFSDLRDIRDTLKARFDGHPRIMMDILSMGMSSDYPLAIAEGSTMVRVGSAIFKG